VRSSIPGYDPHRAHGRVVLNKPKRRRRFVRTRLRVLANNMSLHERALVLLRLRKADPPILSTLGFATHNMSWTLWVDQDDYERARAELHGQRVRPHGRVQFVPGSNFMLLSRPTKMPGPSWSLPAGAACPFMVVKGLHSICGSCYALRGRYASEQTFLAADARFSWVRDCLKTPEGTDQFVDVMVEAIGQAGYRYMRVHDAGDLFSEAYTRAWTRICAELPRVQFWFPTRSWQAPWVLAIIALNALPNVTVRPSALYFGEAPPVIAGLAAGTTARPDHYTCPAPLQGNACERCRVCWDEPDREVSYHARFLREALAA
jgi:hypothetical protein